MESLITKIATTPIIINEKNNELTQVLNKILEWIELIMEYGELCEQKFVYKDVDITNDSDFTLEMRIASLGREYKKWKIFPGELHETGETWSLEKLVSASNTGIVEWYCRKLGLPIETYLKLSENLNVQILGAFYHRMKIISENIENIFKFFAGKKIYNLFDISILNKLLSKPNFKISNPKAYELCIKIKEYEFKQEEITNKYLNIERAIDLSQLTLFTIIKNKLFI
jgi:hypothetical protein